MMFILIVSLFSAWLIVRQYQKVSRLPPGPVALPLIGNLPQIVYYLWTTGGIVSTFDLFRKKYGNIFTLWVGPIPHVSIADYETSHEVFVKQGNKLADIAHSPVLKEFSRGVGLIRSNGEHWQVMRRFALQTFRNMGFGKESMEIKIKEELDARCAEIDQAAINGVTVASASDFFDLTVGSIINSMLVGIRFEDHNKQEFLKIKNTMEESIELFSPFDLTMPVWIMKLFFRKRYEFLVGAQESARVLVASEALKRYGDIKSGKYVIDENNLQDYTDAFLLKIVKGDDEKNFNIEALKTMLYDLWLTGQETTTVTLLCGFNHLLSHPDVMDKAREELLKITNNGARSLSLSDRPTTPYLNAMIGEIQRHASILNVTFWKINKELTYMGGHPVDSGAVITAQLSALHVNDTIFKNPKEFDPERFIRDDTLLQKVIPFGVGKRNCLGESLARSELYLIFGNLLLRYKFEPHGKLSTEETMPYSVAKRAFNLEMRFVKI